MIKKKEKLKIKFINSKIINQTSYKVSNNLIKAKGIKFKGTLNIEINETLKVLKNLNVNPKTFALRSTSSLIKDSLRKKTSDAYQKGIFGAPTFVANNRIFWGQDRIEFVLKEASK